MKSTFENLEKLQMKAQKSCWNAKSLYVWYDTIGLNYRRKWDKMMVDLRGWDEPHTEKETKAEWLEYCEKTGCVYDYNFGDILA
jgi:hypothetical protein|tara:strand:- start:1105 stop:1356 length:252 start_codon:yes stop_codon:yes gene_type:complete